MARSFTKNTANHLTFSDANRPGTLCNGASAISFAAWINAASVNTGSSDNTVYSHAMSTVAGFAVNLQASGKVRVGGRSGTGDTFQIGTGTTTILTGTTYHIGGVFDIPNDKIRVYVNGVQEVNQTVTFGGSTYTHTNASGTNSGIGRPSGAISTALQFSGTIWELALWNLDIGDAGFDALNDGYSPLCLQKPLIYFPLLGNNSPETDFVGSVSGTITGTIAKADHGRVIQHRSRRLKRIISTSGSGAISGTASLTFTPSGTLLGAGELVGSSTITFAPSGSLSGSGALSGTSTITFGQSGTLAGAGALVGSSGLTFAPSGTLLGAGVLSGSSFLTFTPSGTLAGSGELAGTTSIAFVSSGSLDSIGFLVGTSSITFTPSGSLVGSGALAGTASIAFTPSGTLAGSGELAGTTSIAFVSSGTLAGSGELVGTSSIAFVSSGSLVGSGDLTGISTLTFTPSGTLVGSGDLAGVSALTFTPSGTLGGSGDLSGSAGLSFASSGALDGWGYLAGDATLTFNLVGNLVASNGAIVLVVAAQGVYLPGGLLSEFIAGGQLSEFIPGATAMGTYRPGAKAASSHIPSDET